MRFRHWLILSGMALLTASSEAYPADCISARSILADVEKLCGNLKVVTRTRDDPRPNVRVSAVYVEFVDPRTAAERIYNQTIKAWVGHMLFDVAIDVGRDQKAEDTLTIASFYRSPRLLSVRYDRWGCCGSHGGGGPETINVDLGREAILVTSDLFRLDDVANFCWQQFVDMPEKGGDSFKWPFPTGASLAATRALRDPRDWSFTGTGAELAFGPLMGYAAGPYTCRLQNPDLARMVQPGVTAPP
jgi:hypothetical protein